MKITDEKMNEWRKVLVTKEQRQKAAEEAKLLGTAMQQLLPDIFEDKRAIPNCFLQRKVLKYRTKNSTITKFTKTSS